MGFRQLQMKSSRARLGAFEGLEPIKADSVLGLKPRRGVPSNPEMGGDAVVVVLLATVSKQET